MKKTTLVLNVLAVVAAVGITVTACMPRAHLDNAVSTANTSTAPVSVHNVPRTVPVAHMSPAIPADAQPRASKDVVRLVATHVSNKAPMRVRAEWAEPEETLDDYQRSGHVRIYLDGKSEPLQTFEAEASRELGSMSLEFTDLNGDGYVDVVFNNAVTGAGGAAFGADVFLWIPRLHRFVKSETLSQAGEFSPGRLPSCVKVTSKCSSLAWNEEELCFNKGTGRWRTVADSGCTGAEPGPDE